MIPVQQNESATEDDSRSDAEMAAALLGLETALESKHPIKIPTTTVLVNNIPLAEYFPIPADRERILRPFKVGGVLGAYNVFALVRGGGTSGQSGAVALGVAKGLAAHEPTVEPVLRKGNSYIREVNSGTDTLLRSQTPPQRSTHGRAQKDRSGKGPKEGKSTGKRC